MIKSENQIKYISNKLNEKDVEYEKILKEKTKAEIKYDQMNKKYKDKCTNELKLINERERMKISFSNLNKKFEDSKKELNYQIEKSNDLVTKNSDFQCKITNLEEEVATFQDVKSNLIQEISQLKNNEKNNYSIYQDNLNSFIRKLDKILPSSTIKYKKNNLSLNEYMILTSSEIIDLTKKIMKLEPKINELNARVKYLEGENERINKENLIYENKLKEFNIENNNLKKENEDLKTQIQNYQELIKDLKKGSEKYTKEIENREKIISNLNKEIDNYRNKNRKLHNDRELLLTIINRLCRIFPEENLYKLTHELLMNNNLTSDNKETINQHIINEIKRCEDYMKIIKESDMQNQLFNKALSRQIEDLKVKNCMLSNQQLEACRKNYNDCCCGDNNNNLNNNC